MGEDSSSIGPGATTWCIGLAAQEQRPLLPEEQAIVRARLALAKRRDRAWRRTLRLAAALAVVGFPVWFATTDLQPKHWIGFPLFYVLLVCTAGAALLAALVEVIVGFSRLLRGSLALALLLSLATFFDVELAWLSFSAGFSLYVVGMFIAFKRNLDFRRVAKTLPLLERDLTDAVACEFRGVPRVPELPPALKSSQAQLAATREVAFAALPRSGIVVALAGKAVDSYAEHRAGWEPLELMRTAPSAGFEVPLPGGPDDGSVALRHTTAGELSELVKHRARLLRRTCVMLLVGTYVAAFVVRGVENALAQQLDSRLSGTGWLIAMGLAAFATAPQVLLWLRLGRAMQAKRIVVLRDPKEPHADGAPSAELLMGTRIVWTVEGQPAAWRHMRF